jgi:hypothetical protein
MTTFAAILACVILAGLAVFQLLLIAGRPLGRFAWGGRHRVLPQRLRVGSAVSVVLYAAFVAIALDRAQVTSMIPGEGFEQVASWVLTGYFALGVVMNGISRSTAERYTMTPIVLVLAVLYLVLALG